MSADNLIVIKRIGDVWHVWHEFMSCFVEGKEDPPTGENDRHQVFESWEEAKTYAEDLEKEIGFVEYGIVEIGTMSEAVAREQKRLDQKAIEDLVGGFEKGEK